MKSMIRVLLAIALLSPVFGAVNKRNGVSISTASTINGKTPNSSINGLAIAANFQPETITWIALVISAGGGFEADSQDIADALVVQMKTRSYYSKIVYLLPFLGTGIDAARCPLINTLAVAAASKNSMVDGDFSQAVGLTGTGAAGKYLDTLVTPQAANSGNGGGLGIGVLNYTAATGNNYLMGTASSSDARFALFGTTTSSALMWGFPEKGNAFVPTGVPSTDCHWYGQYTSVVLRKFYKDGALVATSTTNDGGVSEENTRTIKFFASQDGDGGGAVIICDFLATFCYITTGQLSDTEAADLDSDLSTFLLTPTGR